MGRLYRGKYIIGIYDQDDNLISVLDNARDFATYFNKCRASTQSILTRLYQGKRDGFFTTLYGVRQKLNVTFIDVTDDE